MAIMKSCGACGKIVPINHRCTKNRNEYQRKRNQTVEGRLYNSNKWKLLTKEIQRDFSNICLWSYFVEGYIRSTNTSHHIVTIKENESLAYDRDNLIPLSSEAHTKVHEYYDNGLKEKCMELLHELKNDKICIENLGKYKGLVDGWKIEYNYVF